MVIDPVWSGSNAQPFALHSSVPGEPAVTSMPSNAPRGSCGPGACTPGIVAVVQPIVVFAVAARSGVLRRHAHQVHARQDREADVVARRRAQTECRVDVRSSAGAVICTWGSSSYETRISVVGVPSGSAAQPWSRIKPGDTVLPSSAPLGFDALPVDDGTI